MRYCICLALLLVRTLSWAQTSSTFEPVDRAGSWYVFWGWHEGVYTDSDLRFTGPGYDLTLANVKGDDRQRPLSVNDYLNPLRGTIPQFNFRLGYFLRPDLDLSFGLDHMKYVVRQNQTVRATGTIAGTNSDLDGQYNDEELTIRRYWLKFEHTDGLNWFNFSLRKHQPLWQWRLFDLRAYEGISVGGLLPRTDAQVFLQERHDKYRLAGYALGASAGLNLGIGKRFFLQAELTGGFFHITSARTTQGDDRASHHAWFGQSALEFGWRWGLNNAQLATKN